MADADPGKKSDKKSTVGLIVFGSLFTLLTITAIVIVVKQNDLDEE